MGGWSTECPRCKKTIEFKEKECDQSGFAWHPGCFSCEICGTLLTEKSFNLRGEDKNQLFCSAHKLTVEGQQPMCKAYFVLNAFRVVF